MVFFSIDFSVRMYLAHSFECNINIKKSVQIFDSVAKTIALYVIEIYSLRVNDINNVQRTLLSMQGEYQCHGEF